MTDQGSLQEALRSTWTPNDLRGLVDLLRRNGVFLAVAAATGAVLMFAVMVFNGPVYDVSAKVIVRLGREMSTPASLDVTDGAQSGALQKRPEDIATEVEILTNPRLVTQTVEKLGADFFLHEDPPASLWQWLKHLLKATKNWVNELSRQLLASVGLRPQTTPLERVGLAIAAGMKVEAARKSDVIEISLGFPDPRAGETFLAAFLEQALASHVEAYRSPGETEFFLAEREARAKELSQAESRLLAVRSQRNAIWSGAEQRALALKAEADLRQQINLATADARQTAAEIKNTRENLNTTVPVIELSSVQSRTKSAEDLAHGLSKLQLDLIALRARYGEGSPEIEEVRRQIEELNAVRAAEPEFQTDSVTRGQNAQYEQLVRDLASKEIQRDGQTARIAELNTQLAELTTQSISAQSLEIEISRAEREIAQLRRSLEADDKALEQARIDEALEERAMSNLKVFMPPTAEKIPSSPSIWRFLAIGAAGGLFLAMGWVFARDFMKRRTVGVTARCRTGSKRWQ